MKITILGSIIGTLACCFATPVPPTTTRPETFEEDPYFHEHEHPISEETWAIWNENPNRLCLWWEQHR